MLKAAGSVRDVLCVDEGRHAIYRIVATLANGDRQEIATVVEGRKAAEYVATQIRAELGIGPGPR